LSRSVYEAVARNNESLHETTLKFGAGPVYECSTKYVDWLNGGSANTLGTGTNPRNGQIVARFQF